MTSARDTIPAPAVALSQLRKLYAEMVAGEMKDAEEAARGILAPAILVLERALEVRDGDARLRAALEAIIAEPKKMPHYPERSLQRMVELAQAALR